MVSVEVAAVPFTTKPVAFVENEHTGAMVTRGVMELQYRVINPFVGVLYPLIGFTLTTPSAPLPAVTLLGATGLCTVIVNCGVTANTVKFSGGVV